MIRAATISPDGLYRYALTRWWGDSLLAQPVFLMLNPSTADAEKDDATLRRCIGFAQAWGYVGLTVVNLYAYRTPYPKALLAAAKSVDVVGPQNDTTLGWVLHNTPRVVAAWGAAPWAQARGREVMAKFPSVTFYCLRRTRDGAPEHPVRLPKGLVPQVYRQGAVAA